MLAAVESILADADVPLALSHSTDGGPRRMIWASRPLLEILASPVPDRAAEQSLFDPEDRDALEQLYRVDGPSPSSTTLRARKPDGSLCRDQVTVQRFPSGTGTYWTARHDIAPTEDAATPDRLATLDPPSSQADDLRRLLLVSELGTGAIRPDQFVEELASLFVPSMATWVAVVVGSPDQDAWRISKYTHEAGGFPPSYDEEVRTVAPRQMRSSDHTAILRGHLPYAFVPHVTWKYLTSNYPPEAAVVMAQLGLASLIIAPLLVGEDVMGILALCRSADRPPFTQADLEIARLIGQRAGRHLHRVEEAWERRQHSARIQKALLPDFTPEPGVEVRMVYRPSAVHTDVGGDWFDAHALEPHRFILAIGDVCGHDVEAAATMAHYRAIIRTFLWQGDSPAEALSLLDDILSMDDEFPVIATAVVALIDRSEPEAFHLTYSAAGHPPGLVLLPSGEVLTLDRAQATPIGIPSPHGPRPLAQLDLPYHSTVVLFTDGVVEQRSVPLRERMDSVSTILNSIPRGSSVSDIQDALLELNDPYRLEDDMCIVIARVTEPAAAAHGGHPR